MSQPRASKQDFKYMRWKKADMTKEDLLTQKELELVVEKTNWAVFMGKYVIWLIVFGIVALFNRQYSLGVMLITIGIGYYLFVQKGFKKKQAQIRGKNEKTSGNA